jgi:hypothetical protein
VADPQYWIREGEPMPSIESLVDVDQYADVHSAPRAPRLVSEMADDELVECIEKIIVPVGFDATRPGASTSLRIIEIGDKVPKDHPLVQQFPTSFRRLG